ncbi:MAG TPA: S9 family peptidase [Thermoanaerobaculia bacterium]|nr:S9 family peptidase [Thermoanaerobaculia bacterium]
MRRTTALVFLLAGALAAPAAPEKTPLTIDDVWALPRVGTPALSPDGTTAAFTVSVWDPEEDKSNADIWLLDVASGASRKLTSHKASDTSPAFSPDGRRVAFLSKRDGDKATQLYVIATDGGEAERLTEMPSGVSSPKWFPDGKKIAFVSAVVGAEGTPESTRKALEAREKAKVKAHVSENRLFRFWDRWLTYDEWPHLFTVDVATRKVTDLLPGSKRFFDLMEGTGRYDVAPDGSALVFAANSTEPPFRTVNSDLFLVPAAGGPPRNLTADNPAEDDDPVFSPDGKAIAYVREVKADGWPDYGRLALLDVATGKSLMLTDGWENSVGRHDFTRDGKAVVFTAEERARGILWTIPVAGGSPKRIWRGGAASLGDVAPDGTVLFAWNDLSHPGEIATVKPDGTGFRTLTSFTGPVMSRIALGSVKDVTFKGAAGRDVQMYVLYPPGFDAAKKYPLVHLVHGGPVGTFGDSFHPRWNAQAFAAPGYIVAMVNFHGSSSFGQAWTESILGAHPEKPFEDVMKATDFLIAEGSVDPKRIAAAGGSYGGFLVNWIEGHTDRFAALVSHAGVYNLMGQYASDATYGRQHSYGGTPFTNRDAVEKWSPNRYAESFRTPMLILHGERDYRVPITQGLELYGTLTAKGVPARLVAYPDENHWILKGQNAKHWYGEVLGFLGTYLKPSEEAGRR